MELVLIRHAPTKSNYDSIFMGIQDVDCTADGLRTARGMKTLPSLKDISVCYSSPLSRAAETAYAIFDEEKIVLDKRLIERDLGAWAGVSKRELRAKFPEAFYDNGMLDFFFTPPNGEDYSAMVLRITEFIACLACYDESSKIALVTHNGVLRVLKSCITGLPMKDVFKESEEHLKPQQYYLTRKKLEAISEKPFLTIPKIANH